MGAKKQTNSVTILERVSFFLLEIMSNVSCVFFCFDDDDLGWCVSFLFVCFWELWHVWNALVVLYKKVDERGFVIIITTTTMCARVTHFVTHFFWR